MGKGRTSKITINISSRMDKAGAYEIDMPGLTHGDFDISEENEQRIKIFIQARERKIRYFM